MDPLLKKLLNSLRCPICRSPIDMISIKQLYRGYNYGCATNLDHYIINVIFNNFGLPFLAVETANIYDTKHKYQLTKRYDLTISTEILVSKIDLERRVEFSFQTHPLVLDKELFDFSNFNLEKAINRIRTIINFH